MESLHSSLQETLEVVPVCRDCGAFVRGSDAWLEQNNGKYWKVTWCHSSCGMLSS